MKGAFEEVAIGNGRMYFISELGFENAAWKGISESINTHTHTHKHISPGRRMT